MAINMANLKKYNEGFLLAPLIARYQDKADFPERWMIEIRNFKGSDSFFHPSGDCYEPIELLYKKLMGELEPKSVSHPLRRVFDCGHFWHGYYQEIIKHMGLTDDSKIEKSLKYQHEDGWTAKGTLDIIVDIPNKGEFIVDMKTVNDTEYDSGIRPDTLKKWTAQVNCYMHWTGIKRAFILAIRKGGTQAPGRKPMHDLKEIAIPYDEDIINQVYRRWSLVWECLQAKTPPTEDQIKSVAFG